MCVNYFLRQFSPIVSALFQCEFGLLAFGTPQSSSPVPIDLRSFCLGAAVTVTYVVTCTCTFSSGVYSTISIN